MSRHLPLNCVISYFFQLYLMFHACVRRFDVIDTVEFFLETKHRVMFIAQ